LCTLKEDSMKRIVFSLAALVATPAFAQQALELPRLSPGAKITQTVGLTDITVDYSSPAVRGRKIWGGLVPYDQTWRTGANSATKITFSKDVTVDGKPVPAGTYALMTIPGKTSWTVILNKDAEQFGAFAYNKEHDLVRVEVRPQPAPHRERMTFLFSDFTDTAATLSLEWEKLRVSIPIKAGTDAQVAANIKAASDGVWRMYANAARYELEKKDYPTGLELVDRSLQLKEDWFNLYIKAALLAGQSKYKEAYPLVEKANDLGSKSKNFFLEPEVKKALSEWKGK
jgi:hypothetical protein